VGHISAARRRIAATRSARREQRECVGFDQCRPPRWPEGVGGSGRSQSYAGRGTNRRLRRQRRRSACRTPASRPSQDCCRSQTGTGAKSQSPGGTTRRWRVDLSEGVPHPPTPPCPLETVQPGPAVPSAGPDHCLADNAGEGDGELLLECRAGGLFRHAVRLIAAGENPTAAAKDDDTIRIAGDG
jgi:hypothetical protein